MLLASRAEQCLPTCAHGCTNNRRCSHAFAMVHSRSTVAADLTVKAGRGLSLASSPPLVREKSCALRFIKLGGGDPAADQKVFIMPSSKRWQPLKEQTFCSAAECPPSVSILWPGSLAKWFGSVFARPDARIP
jgi:hypothetical protein